MINNIDIRTTLFEKYSINKKKNYTVLERKFKRRFPEDKTDILLDNIDNPYINIFVEVMKLTGKNIYLENLYSNLSNSRIIKNKLIQKLMLSNEVYGGYFVTNRNSYIVLGNRDILERNDASLTPYHELFHLLTTRVEDKKTVRIGFQFNEFGTGINEGYTEILTKRYFGGFNYNDYDAYIHFTWIMNMLEEIIGKEKMEHYYFESSIEGLILELEKYLSREKAINFIEDIDLLFNSEDELFSYQKSFLFENKELENEKLDEYYSVNKELRDRIYKTILEINKKRNIDLLIKKEFEDRNNEKKKIIDQEEDLYCDYFKYECKSYKKIKGGITYE